jgi:hypothetical protein
MPLVNKTDNHSGNRGHREQTSNTIISRGDNNIGPGSTAGPPPAILSASKCSFHLGVPFSLYRNLKCPAAQLVDATGKDGACSAFRSSSFPRKMGLGLVAERYLTSSDQGAYTLGLVRGLLARRKGGGVRIGRQDGADLGRGDISVLS